MKTSDLPFVLDLIERRALVCTEARNAHRRVIVDLSLSVGDAERLTEILADYAPRRSKGRVRVRGTAAEALIDDLAPHLDAEKRDKAVRAVARARKAREAYEAARAASEGAE